MAESRLSKVFGSKIGSGSPSSAPAESPRRSTASASPQPQAKPAAAGGAGGAGVKQITIQMPSISLRIDEHFKAKLPFLLLLFLLFAFSLVLFEKSNFSVADFFDVGRLQYNLSKLWSISFVLFLLLFSFAVALAMFYGFGQTWSVSLLVAVPALVIALAESFLFSSGYFWPFIAFALTIGAASFIASFRTQVKFSSIYSTAGTAFLVLVVLSFFVSYNLIAANKDVYIDTLISTGITMSVSQFQGGQAPQTQTLGSVLTPSALKQSVKSFVTTERVRGWFNGTPEFDRVSPAIQTGIVAGVQKKLVAELPSDLSDMFSNIPITGGISSPGAAATARQALSTTPAFAAFYNNFSLLMAIFVASVVAVFAFLMKLISTLFCWLLAKL